MRCSRPPLRKKIIEMSLPSSGSRQARSRFRNAVSAVYDYSAAVAEETCTLLLPAQCLCCSASVSHSDVCTQCDIRLRSRIQEKQYSCNTCFEPALHPHSPQAPCLSCMLFPLGVVTLQSLWSYQHPVEDMIKSWKYGGNEHASRYFAKELSRFIEAQLKGEADLIVSIPSSPSATRGRGYFPLGDMCRVISRNLNCPYFPLALRFPRSHRSQSSLPIADRVRNMAATMTLGSLEIRGKNILLIDDVATTGASIHAASTLLTRAGAREIRAFTLARSPRFQANRLKACLSRQTDETIKTRRGRR